MSVRTTNHVERTCIFGINQTGINLYLGVHLWDGGRKLGGDIFINDSVGLITIMNMRMSKRFQVEFMVVDFCRHLRM